MFTLMDQWRAADDVGRAEIVRRIYTSGGVSAVEKLAAMVTTSWPVGGQRVTGRDLLVWSGVPSFRRAKNRRRRGRVRPEPWQRAGLNGRKAQQRNDRSL